MELVRELTSLFNRWRTAEGVETSAELCELVIFEQFKNILPDCITTYINEHEVGTAAAAAVLADKYILTHKHSFCANNNEDYCPRRFNSFKSD